MKFQEIKLFREILAVFKLKFIVRSPNNVYMQGQLLYVNLTSTKSKTFTITQARPNRCKSTIASFCPFGAKICKDSCEKTLLRCDQVFRSSKKAVSNFKFQKFVLPKIQKERLVRSMLEELMGF